MESGRRIFCWFHSQENGLCNLPAGCNLIHKCKNNSPITRDGNRKSVPVSYNKGILAFLAFRMTSVSFSLLPILSLAWAGTLLPPSAPEVCCPFVLSSAQLWQEADTFLPFRWTSNSKSGRVITSLRFGRETWIVQALSLNFFFFCQSCSGS